MSVTGEEAGEPMKVGIALADIIAGKDAAIAILAALAARDSLGRDERRLFISLLHSATAALVNVAQNALVSGRDARRWGNGHPNLVPYQLFRAADRHLVIAVGNDGQWRACCAALGLDAIAEDARFSTNAGRLEHRAEIVATLQARLSTRAAADWLGTLQRHGVPCGVVKGVREALDGVQSSALTGIAPAAGGSIRLPPPTLGAHSALVREAGWGAFARLRAANQPAL
jgi:crotonobetainyl-CoA:carnitine CoA-transferase CaiB-like acyl-CoA transferase